MLVQTLKSIAKQILSVYKATIFKRSVRRGNLNGQLIILMYHRVLPKTDPRLQNEEPGMYVTPETFDMHLREINKFAQLIHIEDWLKLSNAGQLKNTPYIAITFDDGWADNYEFAFPLLQKHHAPACIFLATDYIGSNTTFWPERLAAMLNQYEYVQDSLDTFFASLNEKLNAEKLKQHDKNYIAHLINTAKQLSDDDIKTALTHIEASTTHTRSKKRDMLSWEQVRTLNDAGIKIGGHTRSHLRLNKHANSEQIAYEVKGCHTDIEEKLGLAPTLFCYPNGDTSDEAITSVKEVFTAAVTTKKGINSSNGDVHMLKRVGVHEDVSRTHVLLKAVLYHVF